jgi:putative transposase
MITAVSEFAPLVGVAAACCALAVSRAVWYRHERPLPVAYGPQMRRQSPERALSSAERQGVLDVLNSKRFQDCAPGEVVATLLDEEVFLCSERTMYRILAANAQVRERRNQLQHPEYKKPELLATGPNQVWSWDITKLKGPVKWTYFHLYVILDIFSRYVVGWMVAERESGGLAEQLISETCEKEGICAGELTIHADRGIAMKSLAVAQLLANLGVTKTHSRPYVSDDNPFSEAQFKTLKYRPGFPARFGCLRDVLSFCRVFFAWYNDEHRHSGIAMLTPADLHAGRSAVVLAARADVMSKAYAANPNRFVHGAPVLPPLPLAVWINPPAVVPAVANLG